MYTQMFRKGLKGTQQIGHSDDLWGRKGNCAEGLMWRKFPFFILKSSELMKILNKGIYLLLVKFKKPFFFFLTFYTHEWKNNGKRAVEPKERIRKPEAGTGCGAAWGWGTDLHFTYSSTDCVLIMGQGFLAKFIKMIVLETSLVVQWWRIYFAVQGTQVQSLSQKIKSNMPWCN